LPDGSYSGLNLLIRICKRAWKSD